MPKISGLPVLSNPADDDELAVVDDSAATTKKLTLSGFKTWLQTLLAWVTPDMLSLGGQYAEIATSQSITNTSFVDLATVGPEVTVIVPASGKIFISFGANMTVGTSGNSSRMTYALSGANTVAASDSVSLRAIHSATTGTSAYVTGIISGLNPGSTTVTMKYRSGPSGSATWSARTLTVIPIS
jgi:hypothetical protein